MRIFHSGILMAIESCYNFVIYLKFAETLNEAMGKNTEMQIGDNQLTLFLYLYVNFHKYVSEAI